MSASAILLISFGACFAVLILLYWAPIHSVTFGKSHSPRLFFARIVAPFDIGMNLFLILGTMVGLHAVTGIGNIIFNVATGIGLSIGAQIVRRLLVPRWTKAYEKEKAAYLAGLNKNKKSYKLAKQAW